MTGTSPSRSPPAPVSARGTVSPHLICPLQQLLCRLSPGQSNGHGGSGEGFSLSSLEGAQLSELPTSQIPAGIECQPSAVQVPAVALFLLVSQPCLLFQVVGEEDETSSRVSPSPEQSPPSPAPHTNQSIIDETGTDLEEFIVYVRNKTRNGLFDEYQEIKSQPPDGTFDHARLGENLAKVKFHKFYHF